MNRSANIYGNVLKFQNTFLFLFSNKVMVIRIGILKMLFRIAYREDPDQTAICQGIFGRQLVFKILEHLW